MQPGIDHHPAGTKRDRLKIAEPADRIVGINPQLVAQRFGVERPAFAIGVELEERTDQRKLVRVFTLPDVAGDAFVKPQCGDAETGVAIALAENPDLIFLDIILPGINGFAALRSLRRDPLTQHIPVIMISGNEQATELFFGSRIGADDFMKKPFSRFEVFARIERLLDADMVPRRVASVAEVRKKL